MESNTEREGAEVSNEVFIRNCKRCGEPFEYTYSTKRQHYCSEECAYQASLELSRLRSFEYRQKERMKARADRIAHQQDKSVWVPDYGEKQRQGLIEQYARVNVTEILGGLKL